MYILKDGITIKNICIMKWHGSSFKVYRLCLALRVCLFTTCPVTVKLASN